MDTERKHYLSDSMFFADATELSVPYGNNARAPV